MLIQIYLLYTHTQMLLLLSCVRLCDSTDCNMPGFPVLHYPLEFAQNHVH